MTLLNVTMNVHKGGGGGAGAGAGGPGSPTFAGHSGGNEHFCRSFGGNEGQGDQVPHFCWSFDGNESFPIPYTSNQTPLGELKNLPPPHFQCAAHATEYKNLDISMFRTVVLNLQTYISAQVRVFFSQFLMGGSKFLGPVGPQWRQNRIGGPCGKNPTEAKTARLMQN